MSNNKKKIPQCCSTEEVTEVIQEYLNNSFTYNRLISRIKDLKELTELREDYVDVYLKKEEKLKEEVSI